MATRPKVPGSGRIAGVPNKRTQELAEMVEERWPGFDPVIALIGIGRTAEAAEDPKLAHDCYKAAAPYLRPQIKSIEVTGLNGEPIAANFGLASSVLERLDRLASSRSGDGREARGVAGDGKAGATPPER